MWISQFVACKDCSKLCKLCMWYHNAMLAKTVHVCKHRMDGHMRCLPSHDRGWLLSEKRKPGSWKSRSWLQVDKQYFFGITMMATSLQATNCGDTIQLVRGQTPPNTPYRNISRLGAKVYIWHRKCRLQGSFLPLVISAAFPWICCAENNKATICFRTEVSSLVCLYNCVTSHKSPILYNHQKKNTMTIWQILVFFLPIWQNDYPNLWFLISITRYTFSDQSHISRQLFST